MRFRKRTAMDSPFGTGESHIYKIIFTKSCKYGSSFVNIANSSIEYWNYLNTMWPLSNTLCVGNIVKLKKRTKI